MATNVGKSSENADGPDCEGDKVVTMMDVLKEQQEFEEDANAVLGASDDKNCTYSDGYIKRQAIYACLTCCEEAKIDSTKRAGVCLACSLNCHENHELIELYTKRNFRCDCGNPKFNSHPCQFTPNKTDLNEDNIYNQNFSGLYCNCHRPYPDPEISDEEEMIQCIICEDWWHASHLDAAIPANDQYSEMICKPCMDKNEFIHDYSSFAVNVENIDVTTMETSNLSITNVTSICNDSLELSQVNGSVTENVNGNMSSRNKESGDPDEISNNIPNEIEEKSIENKNVNQLADCNEPDSLSSSKNGNETLDNNSEINKNSVNDVEVTSGETDSVLPSENSLPENCEANNTNSEHTIPLAQDQEICQPDETPKHLEGDENSEMTKENEETDNINKPESPELTDLSKVEDSVLDICNSSNSNEILNQAASVEKKTMCEKSDVINGSSNESKRKLSLEDNTDEKSPKKQKLDDNSTCVRPKSNKKRFEGATFWASDFRQKLCMCGVCMQMYKDLSVLFLIDPDDTVTAYENLGMQYIEGAPMSQYEKGLEALSTLDRVQQINAMTEYNKMKDSLIDYLKSIQERNEIVKEEDIKNFFAGMKPKREPDGVYFCK